MNQINMMGLPDLPTAANDNFKAQAWLARWKAAGGGWAAGSGSPHLVRPRCDNPILNELARQLADPELQREVLEHLEAF